MNGEQWGHSDDVEKDWKKRIKLNVGDLFVFFPVYGCQTDFTSFKLAQPNQTWPVKPSYSKNYTKRLFSFYLV